MMQMKTARRNTMKTKLIQFAIVLGMAFSLGMLAPGSGAQSALQTVVRTAIPEAHAQTEETYHQLDTTDGAQTHAVGKEANPNEYFWNRYAPPHSISTYGHRIDWLFKYTSWAAFVFFMIMVIALGYFIIKYRERPGHKAYYTHGKSTKSEKWAPKFLDLAVFVSLDLVLMGSSYLHTRDIMWNYPQGEDVVKVQIMPQQWAWNFRYAGKDGIFNTPDDITTINELRIPKGTPVLAQIKSKDVIHGFMAPNVRSQIDAIPGLITKFWFDATETGDFEIACYHLCGTAHYKMKAFMTVMEESDYEEWFVESSEWAQAAYDAEDPSVKWGWNWSINN